MDSAITRLRDWHIDDFDPKIRAIVNNAASFACFRNDGSFNFSHDRDFYKVFVKIEGIVGSRLHVRVDRNRETMEDNEICCKAASCRPR